MESIVYSGSDYHDHFNPESYLNHYYGSAEGPTEEEEGVNPFIFQSLHRVFYEDGVSGDRLIDIGTGPCIYSFLSACANFNEIIATDFTEANRNALKRWVTKEPGCFDWTPIIKHVCNLEGHSDVEKRENMLRDKIKDVLFCDVHQAKPLGDVELAPFDCLTTCFCLEAACNSKDEYLKCLKNMATLLKSGGIFVQIGEPLKFYQVGDKRFAGFAADETFIKSALEQAGFTNLDCRFRRRTADAGKNIDYEFTMAITAKKI
ncbi:nicotinamide N-methyltransferase-like [Ptychodera flava]|uniref:nicotinamide N-methyltransferase-like n=1 Tax=Ptychodera flava TaxID=63121 RepID=UPI00396AABBD